MLTHRLVALALVLATGHALAKPAPPPAARPGDRRAPAARGGAPDGPTAAPTDGPADGPTAASTDGAGANRPGETDREAGQAAFRVAVQAFRANQFSVAAQSFEQAYERDPRPEIAFSIAQANRLQYYIDRLPWRVQRAVQLYQVYLQKLPSGPRATDAIDRLGELEPILTELRRRGELVPYVAPSRTQLVIGAEVEHASVTIDGIAAQLWQPAEVAAGSHEITVEAAGFEPARRRVVITEGRFLPIDVALTPKPGRLAIKAEPGATLYVDGRRQNALRASLPAGEHFVSVTRRGREPWNRSLTIGRDQGLVLDVALQPTAQRKVARWVLGTAAGVGLASGGAWLWSYAARREARELDRARRDLTATPADLQRYNEAIADSRWRAQLATGLGVSTLAIAAVGLGMWWFDQPPPGTSPSLQVQPVPGGASASVSGVF
jgi:PEGA domain